jgi:hypothetical protein
VSSVAFFGISVALGFVAWGMVAARYLWPALRSRPRARALRPLLLPWIVLLPAAAIAGGEDRIPAGIEAERRAKVEYFRDHPFSPLRAVSRFDFPAGGSGTAILGAAADADLRLSADGIAPRHLAIETLPPRGEEADWGFRVKCPGPVDTVRIDGGPPDPGGGDGQIVPEETVIEIGPYAVRPYAQGGSGILILFDSRRTAPGRFEPPRHYDDDPAFRFRAPLVRAADPETLTLQTSLGRTKEYRRVGHFDLPIGGRQVRLHAYQPLFAAAAEGSLAILFSDATSGNETYGSGRYLDLDPPVDGLYTVDFNRAYNPYCAYTDAYNCPIPPPENRLGVAIRAGEKSYRH